MKSGVTTARGPEIESTEMIVDNGCMRLIMNPGQFDVIESGDPSRVI